MKDQYKKSNQIRGPPKFEFLSLSSNSSKFIYSVTVLKIQIFGGT